MLKSVLDESLIGTILDLHCFSERKERIALESPLAIVLI